ncbi:gliding motility-associated protein GldE [Botryobacter ruber]|uniref:gliding motility-associated protein GldE n=1 Tax=Botryobacter ruber TaxID=2171629 RepID=UPI001F0BF3DA|nr:gliding motility-associated protein GldE [Botryobacter ruber]
MESLDSGDPLSYSLLYFLQQTTSLLRIEYLAAIVACFFLLLLSALTSGAEAAFFALSEQELARYKGSSHKAERTIYTLLQNPRKLQATILIFNNAINVSIITLFAYVAWSVFGTTAVPGWAVVSGMLLATFFIVFFGEVLPKVYGNKRGGAIARNTAPFFAVLQTIAAPISKLLLAFSGVIEERYLSQSYRHTIEELHHSLDLSLTNEETSPEERRLLRGIVNFGSITVRQIMRPRSEVAAFSLQETLPELLPKILDWGYSRVPVYARSLDRVEGILYIKDLLPHLDKGPEFRWQDLVRLPFFVSEDKRISELLNEFQAKHVHMAIVVNHAGVTTGLLTLEDVVEEIVGEINDEFDDDEDIIYSQLDENTFIFDGKTSLHDFCKIAEVPFGAFDEVKGRHETVAGLMTVLFDRVPRVGEEVSYNGFHFIVESADSKRVKRVKVDVTSKREYYQKVS